MQVPQGNLFSAASEPLAARMRPRTLDEFVGQDHVLGPGRLLRRAILADRLSSVIFHGPPGTGKTTLARVIAGTTQAEFVALNAVLAGVKDLRAAIADAERAQTLGRRTLLFVDEVHRFNKAQQDALLPSVEAGVVTFIGATTENPFFEVNPALVSRSRVFQLVPLGPSDLRSIVQAALDDEVRGFGRRDVVVDEDALDHLVDVANGDARSLLNAIELAVVTTSPNAAGRIRIDRAAAEESIQRRAVLYDKEGDAHYDVISAFIKSVRGSDPDAALYWLAKMVHAGEDARFILRRLRILASEDVGLADPNALVHTEAAAQAFEAVGMPEGRYHLAQATLYLATAAKSNSTMAFFDALAAVEREGRGDVPTHLKDASRDAEGFGHGQGYLYPHAYRDHWVAQQYLPGALQGRLFYQPSSQGYEASIAEAVARRREAQLGAMLEPDLGIDEILTSGPGDAERDAWVARTTSGASDAIVQLRDHAFALAELVRHERVLDLVGASGWSTFEAMRRTPEGHVWALPGTEEGVRTLRDWTRSRPELERPVVLARPQGPLLPVLREEAQRRYQDADLLFDVVLAVGQRDDAGNAPWLEGLPGIVAPGGRLIVLDPVRGAGQRLHELVRDDLDVDLYANLEAAEARLAGDEVELRERALAEGVERAGFQIERRVEVHLEVVRQIKPAVVARWFQHGSRLAGALGELGVDEMNLRQLEGVLARRLSSGVPWRSRWLALRACVR